jgi:hypothetical protein
VVNHIHAVGLSVAHPNLCIELQHPSQFDGVGGKVKPESRFL